LPFVYRAICIPVGKRTHEIAAQDLITRDLARIDIKIALVFSASRDYPIEYLDSDEAQGVEKILTSLVKDALRGWASAKLWREAIESGAEAKHVLMKTLGEEGRAIKEARNEVLSADAEKPFTIPRLGIVIHSVSVTDIGIRGRLAETAERFAKQKLDRDVERARLEQFALAVDQLKSLLDITTEQAIEIAQMERGQVASKVAQLRAGASKDTIRLVETILTKIAG
jgi:hypothetical protein